MKKLSIEQYTDYWENTHGRCSNDLASVIFPNKPVWFNRFFDRVQKLAISRYLKKVNISGKRILDLGCGRGRWLDYFGDRGVEVQGIDLSQNAVRICRKKGYTCHQGSIEDLSILQGRFDYITSITVLLHLPYAVKEKAIEQIGRKLRVGGKAILIESTWDDPAPHVYSLSNEKWLALFRKNGMKLVYEEAHLWNFARRSGYFQQSERIAIAIDYMIDFLLMCFMKGKRGKKCMQHLLVFEKTKH